MAVECVRNRSAQLCCNNRARIDLKRFQWSCCPANNGLSFPERVIIFYARV